VVALDGVGEEAEQRRENSPRRKTRRQHRGGCRSGGRGGGVLTDRVGDGDAERRRLDGGEAAPRRHLEQTGRWSGCGGEGVARRRVLVPKFVPLKSLAISSFFYFDVCTVMDGLDVNGCYQS